MTQWTLKCHLNTRPSSRSFYPFYIPTFYNHVKTIMPTTAPSTLLGVLLSLSVLLYTRSIAVFKQLENNNCLLTQQFELIKTDICVIHQNTNFVRILKTLTETRDKYFNKDNFVGNKNDTICFQSQIYPCLNNEPFDSIWATISQFTNWDVLYTTMRKCRFLLMSSNKHRNNKS